MPRSFALCLTALALAGCAALSKPVLGQTYEIDTEQLTVDATTLEEATAFMGPPLTTKTAPDGSIALGYTLHDKWDDGEILILFFTPQHVLSGKATVSDEDEDRTDT
jgi:hypothetical protein